MPAITTDGVVILRKPPKPTKPAPKAAYGSQAIYDSGEFAIQLENPFTKKWIDATPLLLSCTVNEDVATCAVEAKLSLSNIRRADERRIANFVRKGTNVRLYYATGPDAPLREMHRFRVWERTAGSMDDPKLDMQLYDHLMHLQNSDCAVLYSTSKKKKVEWTVSQIHKDFCRKFKIPMGHVPKSKTKVPYLQHKGTMYDFLIKLWTLDMEATKRKWLIRMDKGLLSVTAKTAKGVMWELTGYKDGKDRDIGSLIRSQFSTGINEETATALTVKGSSKSSSGKTAAVVLYGENTKLLNEMGRLHKTIEVEGVTSKARLKKVLKSRLNKQAKSKYSASIEALGIPFLRAGDPVWNRDDESGLVGRFYVGSVAKNIGSDGSFTMSINVNWLDIVPKLEASAEDLRTAEKDDGKVLANGMPSWLRATLRRAAAEAGVPESWAESDALAKLLQKESSFKPTAQNPTSTAYGLFQFLDSTWAGTGIPKTSDAYLQCVAGLIYIKNRYKTPAKAWDFWQSHNWY